MPMEIATCWVILHENGNNVFKKGVTPAEAQVLARLHKGHAKKHPITDIIVTGRAASIKVPGVAAYKDEDGDLVPAVPAVLRDRTATEEVARLRTIYHKLIIDELFPGANPKVPETFADAFPPIAAMATDEATANSVTTEELPLPLAPVPSPITKSDEKKSDKK